MYAVEFNSKVTDGRIEIPKEYQHEFNSNVKVILLRAESENKQRLEKMISSNIIENTKNAMGIFKEYANPNLVSQEKNAWGEAVKEKYVNS